MKIANIHARGIIDSRGNPTIEVDVVTSDGHTGRASVPSGASTGQHEAIELRDGGKAFGGQGVLKAIKNVNDVIASELIGQQVTAQSSIDEAMIKLDGTPNKRRLGANALLGVSLAVAKAAASCGRLPLYRYIASMASTNAMTLPMPMMNIINGGKHASGALNIQEIMIIPIGASSVAEAIRMGSEIFHGLGQVLKKNGLSSLVGDEGGYGPNLKSLDAALDCIAEAVKAAGYLMGQDVAIALDVAASEFYSDGKYTINSDQTKDELIAWYQDLANSYPIVSIEDGLDEDDWTGWRKLNESLGSKIQLVGDDLLVTNPDLLKKGIEQKAANAILIKPNQIGTLSETIEAVKLAQAAGWGTIVSHRSGETEDTTIAHLAVGLGAGQIKTGSLSRSERTAKYNELLRISEGAHLPLARPFKT